jgi:hypothetical protein
VARDCLRPVARPHLVCWPCSEGARASVPRSSASWISPRPARRTRGHPRQVRPEAHACGAGTMARVAGIFIPGRGCSSSCSVGRWRPLPTVGIVPRGFRCSLIRVHGLAVQLASVTAPCGWWCRGI